MYSPFKARYANMDMTGPTKSGPGAWTISSIVVDINEMNVETSTIKYSHNFIFSKDWAN